MQQRKLVGRVPPRPKEQLPVDADGKVIDPVRPRCGAHSRRTGKPCRNWAMPNGRCRMHGGKNKGPNNPSQQFENKHAFAHGLYECGMHPEEKDLYGTIAIGSVQDEIRVVKLLLRRALRSQFYWEACRGQIARTPEHGVKQAMLDSGLWDVEELVTETGDAGFDKDGLPLTIDKAKIVRRKTDFNAEIRQYAKLLDRLENTQRQLEEVGGDADRVAKLAEDLRLFTESGVSTLPGGEI